MDKIINEKVMNLQANVKGSMEGKADKCIDTNMKEIRKIKQIEKIAEEKKEYWETNCKNYQKKLVKVE